MADEIQTQHEAISILSVEATEPQNEPRDKIMYQTAKWLLARRGVRLHEFAIYKYMVYFMAYAVFFAQYMYFKDKKQHTLLGIKVMHWTKFCFYTIITIPISIVASFVILSLIESCFLLKKNMLYFRHGLKIKVATIICFVVALRVWFLHLRPAGQRYPATKNTVDFVLDTIISLLLGSVLWVFKSTILLVLASSFCFNSFFDRAVESLVHEYVITALSLGANGSPGPDPEQREKKDNVLSAFIRRIIEGVSEFISGMYNSVFVCVYVALQGHEPHHEVKMNIRELMKVPGEEFPLYTKQLLIEAISGSVSWTFQENGPRFKNEMEVREAARRIFTNVAKPGNSYIELEDLKRPGFLTDDILDVMLPMLEVDKNRRITLQSFQTWMVKTYNFRVVLKRAVANNKMLLNRLKIVSDGLLILGIILLWLGLTKTAKWNVMIIIFTQIAAGAFIFGDSVKKTFEGIVFLFAVHPFDVGDCCVIGGIPVVIEQKSIMTTTVKKFDTQLMYYPNAVLATLPISNYTRHPHSADSLVFSIDLMTEEKIEQLKHEIKRYLEENDHYWQPGHSLVTKEIDGMDKLKMVFNFNHTIRFREFAVRDERKFELIMELRKIFKKLNLKTEVNLS